MTTCRDELKRQLAIVQSILIDATTVFPKKVALIAIKSLFFDIFWQSHRFYLNARRFKRPQVRSAMPTIGGSRRRPIHFISDYNKMVYLVITYASSFIQHRAGPMEPTAPFLARYLTTRPSSRCFHVFLLFVDQRHPVACFFSR
jgi:hypothetical protein